MLYLSASPPLEHSGADHELLKTKRGATGLALSSFGFGKKRPQRNATLKGKSQLQMHNNTLEGTDKQVRKDSHFLFSSRSSLVFFVCFCLSHFLSRVEALWTSLRSSADILLGSWAMLPVMMVTMTTRARPLVIMARDVLPPGGALVKCLLWPVIKRTHG